MNKQKLLRLLRQSSTWRGLIAIATGAGLIITPAMAEVIIGLGVMAAGAVDVVRDEDKAAQAAPASEG